EREPKDLVRRREHIVALLAAGDRDGARRAAADLIEAFAPLTDPLLAGLIAAVCVLPPDAVPDPEAPIRLAKTALQTPEGGARGPRPGGMAPGGPALPPAGRSEGATQRREESARPSASGGHFRRGFSRARAPPRLGHRGGARRWLEKLRPAKQDAE